MAPGAGGCGWGCGKTTGGGRGRRRRRGGGEAWRARRQYAWAAGERNVFGILQFLFARAGLELSSAGASSESANLQPAFTVNPGDSGLTAVRRLLAMLPDVVYFRGEFGFLKEPLATEVAAYAYGTDHALLAGRYRAGSAAACSSSGWTGHRWRACTTGWSRCWTRT